MFIKFTKQALEVKDCGGLIIINITELNRTTILLCQMIVNTLNVSNFQW